ncbi:MAG: hypothetical protein F4Y68_07360 [Boseongicola sp. SB0665_bin_10]|nr:hypothetical protein [Boseongicola sp. SB0665_bin_10]
MVRNQCVTQKYRRSQEIRSYPAPVAGCDAQFNHLVGMRGSISEALAALERPRFVATPRTLEPPDEAS